ncbi:MAG: tRNA pseudouridine(55) synthase TruB [Candidatus Pacebacteria bacterium]|nr:tRNA pseudouridine(55) synthase TruB [Candidatus Paceibacterota bacterium]MBP9842788.1 tRNA pseudouridine(55) synthase TruB [Candidatus Paceibacterota bacterium]
MAEVPELLLIDKPKGITSMDVIRILRRQLQIRKIGHAGTLDPLATGLMLVGVGVGTKKLTELIKLDKEYVAEVRIGERRSTGDLEGIILEEREVVELSQNEVKTALVALVGVQNLPVSAYSAIKIDGVAMYKKARKAEQKGEVVTEVPMREMRVDEVELQKFEIGGGRAVATVRFVVGSGTYIRSLAEELGRRLGYPATLQNLRRTKVGVFDIKDAQPLE